MCIRDSSNSNRITFGNSDDLQIFHSSGANYIKAVNLQSLNFATNNTNRAMFESGGHFRPTTDSTYDLGITGTRWRNVYADTLYGSGANLTNLPAPTPATTDIQVVYEVTASGSSAYLFSGNGVSGSNNEDLYLIRGQKYRFINNSGGSHPFEIRSSSGGSAYNTGVTNNGAASGNIDFAPTFDSPEQLVYQCTSHGGMVGNIYIRGASGANTNVGVSTFSGNIVPSANDTYDLGATGTRWANAYVNDMHFSNKGSSNSVDGTWGDWTLQEGENKIFMINNRTGKKYSLKMEEEE